MPFYKSIRVKQEYISVGSNIIWLKMITYRNTAHSGQDQIIF
jgi:hypothetical protein